MPPSRMTLSRSFGWLATLAAVVGLIVALSTGGQAAAARWIASGLIAALAVAAAILAAQALGRGLRTLRSPPGRFPMTAHRVGPGVPSELAALVAEVQPISRRYDRRTGVSDEYRGVVW